MDMQRIGETYTEWEERTYCDNASILGSGVGIKPQCYNGKREFEVTVIYNEFDSDVLVLCHECLKNLRKDARRYGYKVKARRLKGD